MESVAAHGPRGPVAALHSHQVTLRDGDKATQQHAATSSRRGHGRSPAMERRVGDVAPHQHGPVGRKTGGVHCFACLLVVGVVSRAATTAAGGRQAHTAGWSLSPSRTAERAGAAGRKRGRRQSCSARRLLSGGWRRPRRRGPAAKRGEKGGHARFWLSAVVRSDGGRIRWSNRRSSGRARRRCRTGWPA